MEDHPFGKKQFTHKEYLGWYKDNDNGDYIKDVQAMCIDGYQIRSFIRKFEYELMTKDEKAFIDIIRGLLPKELLRTNKKFSMICTYHGENSIDFKHEFAHAAFYLDKEYRDSVKRIFRKVNLRAKREMFSSLKELDYNGDYEYLVDEANARLASEHSLDGGFKKNVHIKDELIGQLKGLLKDKLGV